jgi:hypothetical protein
MDAIASKLISEQWDDRVPLIPNWAGTQPAHVRRFVATQGIQIAV